MHDQKTREQAKALYQQHGAAYVADKLGIPERTIRRWALAEGWQHRMTVVAGQQGRCDRRAGGGRSRLADAAQAGGGCVR
jgi:uncharacterized protein YjcR